MKKIAILIMLIFVSVFAHSQIITKDTISSKLCIGVFPSINYIATFPYNDAPNLVHLFSCMLNPYVAYNVFDHVFLKANAGYEFFYSDFYEKDNFAELGASVRYEIPFVINKGLFKQMNLYCELGYYLTNYRMVEKTVNVFTYKDLEIDEDFLVSDKLDQSKYVIPIGFTCNLTSRLFVDINWQYAKYTNGASEKGFLCGVGYNFGQK